MSYLFPALLTIAVLVVICAWVMDLQPVYVTAVCAGVLLLAWFSGQNPTRRKRRKSLADIDDPYV